MVLKKNEFDIKSLQGIITQLEDLAKSQSGDEIKRKLRDIIPECYQPNALHINGSENKVSSTAVV